MYAHDGIIGEWRMSVREVKNKYNFFFLSLSSITHYIDIITDHLSGDDNKHFLRDGPTQTTLARK